MRSTRFGHRLERSLPAVTNQTELLQLKPHGAVELPLVAPNADDGTFVALMLPAGLAVGFLSKQCLDPSLTTPARKTRSESAL